MELNKIRPAQVSQLEIEVDTIHWGPAQAFIGIASGCCTVCSVYPKQSRTRKDKAASAFLIVKFWSKTNQNKPCLDTLKFNGWTDANLLWNGRWYEWWCGRQGRICNQMATNWSCSALHQCVGELHNKLHHCHWTAPYTDNALHPIIVTKNTQEWSVSTLLIQQYSTTTLSTHCTLSVHYIIAHWM